MPKVQPNNAQVVDKCSRRLYALETHVKDAKTTVDINGKTHTLAQVKGIYQASLDVRAEIHTQRAVLKGLLKKRVDVEATRLAANRALKPWAVNKFGEGSAEARDFGFPPPKAATLTAEEKQRAVERRLATRKARRTMGKKQKAGIRGVVAGEENAETKSGGNGAN